MNREFRFPPNSPTASHAHTDSVPVPGEGEKLPPAALPVEQSEEELETTTRVITPSAIEVPPPPPVEKEGLAAGHSGNTNDEGDDDVGDTVEVNLDD